jgi:iron complex transport system permease protein
VAELHSALEQDNLKKKLLLISLLLLLFVSVGAAVVVGAVKISLLEFRAILFPFSSSIEVPAVIRDILIEMRLPRVFLAAAVGASLAVAGAAFQGLFRNPMADPYVIGVSSGAALGAVAAILSETMFSFGGLGAVPLFAFVGGLLTLLIVYQMARVGSVFPVMTLLLAGIAVSAFLSAFVSLLTFFSGEMLHQVVFWMMGGFSGATWLKVQVMVPYLLVGFCCIYFYARELNALLLGEETARYLGANIEKVKKIILVGASLLVAAAVSVSGMIGFVGLVVPHLVRLLIGPDHRFLLPASALLGASLLINTDTLARTIIAPTELPVGIITALIGAPLFIYLLKKRKRLRYFNSAE